MSDSTVALVVSLIALGMSTGQVLQQYISTAEGYRRCQETVMGPWSDRTRRNFRFGQLRFETIFQSPHFMLKDTQDAGLVKPGQEVRLCNDRQLPAPEASDDPVKARVTWLYFLNELCEVQNMIDGRNGGWPPAGEGVCYPALISQPRSWDFMP